MNPQGSHNFQCKLSGRIIYICPICRKVSYGLLNGRTWKTEKRTQRIQRVSNGAKIVECVSLFDIVYLTSLNNVFNTPPNT